ncbi:DUF427 domain-containing protein [Deinococcus yavapaiensis]|uniref:Uncharacterized protein (DUF427 family) n=1 Tax=Deinococcus yavapaiensis KR-236 TaxID=694435 RepID=A0A318S961_9DEIO|nr:DUF427 domain-containing protein [Deinococcus yavapaiensis]PYE53561.1 uncharacterized protein (DUF427 family) [Deinococcus yavapaiensis KR-236]
MKPTPIPPEPGQESVWTYPRPPRLERTSKVIEVVFAGEVVARTTRAWRVLETSHPPVYYLPREDVRPDVLALAAGASFCEFKGEASYWTVRVGERRATSAAWSYERPAASFEAIAGHVAFYASLMDACFVAGERVTPQPGGFYGGWITSDVVGPFKGELGSFGW